MTKFTRWLMLPEAHVITLVVPPDHCFVLGDNSPCSVDSRQFGPVPVCTLLGHIVR